MTDSEVLFGSEFKLNINVEPISGVTMDDYDFSLEVSTPRSAQRFTKPQLIRIDQNNYMVALDSNILGIGPIKCVVTAEVPDDDFDGGYRTEVRSVNTGIVIRRK